MTFRTVTEIAAANKANGQTWFSAENRRFFGSRILPGVIGGRFFVTSERAGFGTNDRAFSVRRADDLGRIDTVGEFCGFRTSEQARGAARLAAWQESMG